MQRFVPAKYRSKHFLYNVFKHDDQKKGLETIWELRNLFKLDENSLDFVSVSRFVLTIFSEMNAANCFCVFNSSAEPDAFAPDGYLKKGLFTICLSTHFAEIISKNCQNKLQSQYCTKRDFNSRQFSQFSQIVSIQTWWDESEASRKSQNHEPAYKLLENTIRTPSRILQEVFFHDHKGQEQACLLCFQIWTRNCEKNSHRRSLEHFDHEESFLNLTSSLMDQNYGISRNF